jgi:L,D-peptidoglycan transpeptidase YkuD (ErfK/YbiS/YcfS/YnhG family)
MGLTTNFSRRELGLVGAVAAAQVVLTLSLQAWAGPSAQRTACPADGVIVQVDSRARTLSLCRNGFEEAAFRVALGRRGLDKKAEGDGRTPRGRYPLGPARPSSRYHRFLPVGYPTVAEMQRGLTGSDIGVHGPHEAFFWLGRATSWPDWTRGCIAVGTRADVDRIAAWVRAHGVQEILIR